MRRTRELQPQGYWVSIPPPQPPKRRAWPIRAGRWIRRHRLWLIPLAAPCALLAGTQLVHRGEWWVQFVTVVLTLLTSAAVVMGAADRWDRAEEVRFARATAVGLAVWIISGAIFGVTSAWTMFGIRTWWFVWGLVAGWTTWTGVWLWHKRTRGPDKVIAEWDLQWQMIIHRMRPQPLTNTQIIDVDMSDEHVDALLIKLDRGRQNIGDLRAAGESILSAWEYPDETTFRVVKHGGNRNWAWFKIQHANPLAERREWDEDLAPTSFLDEFIVGFTPEGGLIKTTLPKAHWFIVGQTQWGKSTWLSLKMAQLAACDDVLIWVIDLKGGGMAAPWRPCIDWLATTHAEAEEMLAAAKRIINARSALTSDHVPSPEDPAVVIVIDETNEAFGQGTGTSALVGLGVSVASLGAGMSVELDAATQIGGLSSMGDERIRSNLSKCLAFRCQDDSHAAYALEDWKHLSASKLDVPGMFYFKDQAKPSVLGRGFWISTPKRAQLARKYADRRPRLPDALQLHAGEGYLNRHVRRAALKPLSPTTREESAVSTPAEMAAAIERDLPRFVSVAQMDAAAAARAASGLPPLTAERAVAAGKERFVAALQAGPRSPKELVDASGMSKSWVSSMLAKLGEYGAVQQDQARGPYRAVPGMDLHEALEAIRTDRRKLQAKARQLVGS